MLRKLMKYEWKNTYKISVALLLFIALMTLLGCISFHTPFWNQAFSNAYKGFGPMDLMGVMVLLLYVFSLIGAVYGLLIYIGISFYRSMYSDEGYLTHTLPVTSHQLLISKILVAVFWYLIITAAVVLSVGILIMTVAGMILEAQGMHLWQELFRNWDMIVREFQNAWGVSIAGAILQYVLQIIVGSFGSVTILFGAITLGQLSSKHKVMMSILSYIGILVIVQIISSAVMMPVSMYTTRSIMENADAAVSFSVSSVSLAAVAINVIVGAVLYFLSNFIITRKLNLE